MLTNLRLLILVGVLPVAVPFLKSPEAPTGLPDPAAFSPMFAAQLERNNEMLDVRPEEIVHSPGEQGIIIWNPISGSITSGCAASGCVLSGCGGSGCAGSACGLSGCSASLCAGSGCVGSGCGGSACAGSGCGGSLCFGSGCALSGCAVSGCILSGCLGSGCLDSGCAISGCLGSFCYMSACLTSVVCADPNCGGNPLMSTQPPPCFNVALVTEEGNPIACDANGNPYPLDEGRMVGSTEWWDLVIGRSVNQGGLYDPPVRDGTIATVGNEEPALPATSN